MSAKALRWLTLFSLLEIARGLASTRTSSTSSSDRPLKWEADLRNYWKGLGVTSRPHLNAIVSRADSYSPFKDPEWVEGRLRGVALATQQPDAEQDDVEALRTAAQLVARAPGLLGYNPLLLAEKIAVLESYLVGVDVRKMVARQPTLLQRDIETRVAHHIQALVTLFPKANVVTNENHP